MEVYKSFNQEKIEEGNRLIGEFMGKKFSAPLNYMYDKSWDWLMPVTEKIESIHDEHHGYFGVHISSNSCSIQGTNLWLSVQRPTYGAVYMSDPNAILATKLESTWYNVVEFIEWYNEDLRFKKAESI